MVTPRYSRRFTKIKYGMLYFKPNVRVFKGMDNDYSLKLECDCAIPFVSQALVDTIKKKREELKYKINKLVKTSTTETWYLGRVYKMHHKVVIGGLSIDNRLTSTTGLPIWKHGYVDIKIRMVQCGPTI